MSVFLFKGCFFCTPVLKMYSWLKDYLGTIQFNPKEELEEIPNHSAFFILSPDNRFVCVCVCVTGVALFCSV